MVIETAATVAAVSYAVSVFHRIVSWVRSEVSWAKHEAHALNDRSRSGNTGREHE